MGKGCRVAKQKVAQLVECSNRLNAQLNEILRVMVTSERLYLCLVVVVDDQVACGTSIDSPSLILEAQFHNDRTRLTQGSIPHQRTISVRQPQHFSLFSQ